MSEDPSVSTPRRPVPDEKSSGVERLTWEEFLDRLVWEQGEHVSMIGPTGAGKTTLSLGLLHLREYVLLLGTKPRDSVLAGLTRGRRPGWRLVRSWANMPRLLLGATRIVFWPKFDAPEDVDNQAYEMGQAMRGAFMAHGWCIVVDEVWYMTNVLGLKRMLEILWTQGRSVGISLVAGTQRPAHVPLHMYDQATHVFFWRDNDERNLARISGMNGLRSALIRQTVAALPKHHVLYVNTKTGYMAITKAPAR